MTLRVTDVREGHRRSHDAHRMHELLGRGILEKDHSPSTKCFEDVIVALESVRMTIRLGTFASRTMRPVGSRRHCRHLDVHEHDVRPNRTRHGDRLFTIARFADDFDVVFGFEIILKPVRSMPDRQPDDPDAHAHHCSAE